jgi:hypothetical protein
LRASGLALLQRVMVVPSTTMTKKGCMMRFFTRP